MSIIAAGTTTTTALSSTGNTDGTLQLQVNGTTPSVTLNTLGAIGVGSTPSFGNSGQVLTSGGSTVAPTWTSVTSSQWTTTGSDIYYNTGNVGIGTSSPSNRLSIVTASGSDGFVSVKSPLTETAGVLIDGGTSSNKGAILKFSKDATVKWQMGTDSAIIGGTTDNFHLYGGGANAILFSTNATQRYVIGSAGQLGIGSSPSYGTSGQVLTSGGASAAPTWSTPASGSWVLLTTVSATGSSSYATVDNAFDSTYDMYAIVISGARPSGPNTSNFLLAQQKLNGTYQTGSTYYSEHQFQYFNNANYLSYFGNSTVIYMAYVASGISSATSSVLSMTVYIPTPYASTFKNMWWMGGYQNSGQARFFGSGGWYNDTNPLTGVRFFFDNGNMNGTFSLYGIKK